jgi:hypothetical protein
MCVVRNAVADKLDLCFSPKLIFKKNITYNYLGFMRVCGEVLYNKDTFFITKQGKT